MATDFVTATNALLGVLAPFVSSNAIPAIVHVFNAQDIGSSPGTYIVAWEVLLEHGRPDRMPYHPTNSIEETRIYIQMPQAQLSTPSTPMLSLEQLAEDIITAFHAWNSPARGYSMAVNRARAAFVEEVGHARLTIQVRTVGAKISA